jgi:hypothetical protein
MNNPSEVCRDISRVSDFFVGLLLTFSAVSTLDEEGTGLVRGVRQRQRPSKRKFLLSFKVFSKRLSQLGRIRQMWPKKSQLRSGSNARPLSSAIQSK